MRSYDRGSGLLQVIRESLAEEETSELRSEGSLAVYEVRELMRLEKSFLVLGPTWPLR